MIKIDVSNKTIFAFDKCYFRFRVSTGKLNQLLRKNESKNSFFEHALTVTEVLDFRLNEKRNFNPSMAECIINEGEFIIKKIHFLLLVDAKDDIISYGNNYSCRELEKDLWNSYIDDEYINRNVIAYHWKKKDGDNNDNKGIVSFNNLIKIKFRSTNAKAILGYIIALLIFNFVSFYIINFFDNDIKPLIKHVFNIGIKKHDTNGPVQKLDGLK